MSVALNPRGVLCALDATYCLSKTVVLFVGWPCAFNPFDVTVSILPSFEMTIVLEILTLPSTVSISSRVDASTHFVVRIPLKFTVLMAYGVPSNVPFCCVCVV